MNIRARSEQYQRLPSEVLRIPWFFMNIQKSERPMGQALSVLESMCADRGEPHHGEPMLSK